MFSKADNSFSFAIAAALVLFFLGGILTTIVPPMVDKSWGRPFENHDAAKGPTGKLQPYTAQQLKGRAIYVREGCWYCHTQQTRTLVADTVRSGWRGVRSPPSGKILLMRVSSRKIRGRYRLLTGRKGARLLPVKPSSVLVESAPEIAELETRTDSLPATWPDARLVMLANCQLFTTYL